MTGIPVPGSDVDLCIVVAHSPVSPRHRIPEFLPTRFPVGMDLFIYTLEEFEALKMSRPGWFMEIASGREV